MNKLSSGALALILALLSFWASISVAQSANKFAADVIRYNKRNFNGVVSGKMYYDMSAGNAAQWAQRINWYPRASASDPTIELFTYSRLQGNERISAQYRYLMKDPTCCDASSSTHPFYHIQSKDKDGKSLYVSIAKESLTPVVTQGAVINGQQLAKSLTQASTTQSYNKYQLKATYDKQIYAQYIWVNTNNLVVRAEFNNGDIYDFRNHAVNSKTFAYYQPISKCPVPKCSAEFDVMFVLDESGSIGTTDYSHLIKFIKSFVNTFTWLGDGTGKPGIRGIRAGVQRFSSGAPYSWRIPITDNKNSFLRRVGSRQGNYLTNLASGMKGARLELEDNGRDQTKIDYFMIILTDGVSLYPEEIQTETNRAKQGGIKRLAVGVDQYDEKQLLVTVDGKSDRLLEAKQFNQVNTLLDPLVRKTCDGLKFSSQCSTACHGFCDCGAKCLCPTTCELGLLLPCKETSQACRQTTGTCLYKNKDCKKTKDQNGNVVTNYCLTGQCNPNAKKWNQVCPTTEKNCNKNCEVGTKDKNSPSCCRYKPKTCPPIANCKQYKCDTADDTCKPQPITGCKNCGTFLDTCKARNKDDCKIPECLETPSGNDPASCKFNDKLKISTAQGGCDDQDPCTTDTCVNGKCVHTPFTPQDDPCAKEDLDGNTCTTHFCDNTGTFQTKDKKYKCKLSKTTTLTDCEDGDYCTIDKIDTKDPKCCIREDRLCGNGTACTINNGTCIDGPSDKENDGKCHYPTLDCVKQIKEDRGIKELGDCVTVLCTEQELPGIKYDKKTDSYVSGTGCYTKVERRFDLSKCKPSELGCHCDPNDRKLDVNCPSPSRVCPKNERLDGAPPCACKGIPNDEPCGVPLVDRCGRCAGQDGYCDNNTVPNNRTADNKENCRKNPDQCWDTPKYCPCPASGKVPATFPLTGVIAGAIGAGVIAAIVVAVLVVLLATGGTAGYFIYAKNVTPLGEVQNNPLYRENPNSGNNPFFEDKIGSIQK